MGPQSWPGSSINDPEVLVQSSFGRLLSVENGGVAMHLALDAWWGRVSRLALAIALSSMGIDGPGVSSSLISALPDVVAGERKKLLDRTLDC